MDGADGLTGAAGVECPAVPLFDLISVIVAISECRCRLYTCGLVMDYFLSMIMKVATVMPNEAIEIQKEGVSREFPLGVEVRALVALGST